MRQGILFEDGVMGSAVLSDCGTYRYLLRRTWDRHGRAVNFVMLNPSTTEDDPTIRRCLGFARAWGFGGLAVTNLFALRATDPAALKGHPDPVGPENDEHLRSWARSCGTVVCAWGNDGALRGRAAEVLALFRREMITVQALRVTQEGHPGHPLYLPADLAPIQYNTP